MRRSPLVAGSSIVALLGLPALAAVASVAYVRERIPLAL